MVNIKKPDEIEHECDEGWIHIQHPTKPPGVIMNSVPCIICNKDGKKKFPDPKITFTYSISKKDKN